LPKLDFLAPGFLPQWFGSTTVSSTGGMNTDKTPRVVTPPPTYLFHPPGTGQGTSTATAAQTPAAVAPCEPGGAAPGAADAFGSSSEKHPIHPTFSPAPLPQAPCPREQSAKPVHKLHTSSQSLKWSHVRVAHEKGCKLSCPGASGASAAQVPSRRQT